MDIRCSREEVTETMRSQPLRQIIRVWIVKTQLGGVLRDSPLYCLFLDGSAQVVGEEGILAWLVGSICH